MRFDEIKLSEQLAAAIDRLGFTEATEIQGKSIPAILEGKDVVGESATGSGKTLAFGCGIVETVIPGKGIQSLVMTPTRELAEQVMSELKKLALKKKMKIISIYGGVSMNPQFRGLETADVVVATPGRLLDHMSRGTIDLSQVKVLVLDEADRMFDMGFIDDVETIIRQCPKKRQSLFFSATISSRVKKLANRHLVTPIYAEAKNQVDPSKLTQVYYEMQRNQKLSLLIHLLNEEENGLVMVFCNTRRTTDFVTKNIKANGMKATAIHGGLSQNKRSNTLDVFNKGKVSVLVCTDVAARGLHIDNVSHVYNYEIPNDSTDYVHRIGRTARAGEAGKVINLFCDADYDGFSRIFHDYPDFSIKKLSLPKLQRVEIVKADDDRRGGFSRGGSRFGGRGRSSGGRGGSSFSRGRPSGNRGGSSFGRSDRGGSSFSRGRDDSIVDKGGSSFGRSDREPRSSGRSSGDRGGSSFGRSNRGGSSFSRGRPSGDRGGSSFGRSDRGGSSFSRGRSSGDRGGSSFGRSDRPSGFAGRPSSDRGGSSFGRSDRPSGFAGRPSGDRGGSRFGRGRPSGNRGRSSNSEGRSSDSGRGRSRFGRGR
ncbi:DEAD/DEAH box helicase [Candidatus Woesearchaeota archaeon]|jgi:superfamily II DNA/RNA helicase|nr:DEAD/DEAH box helicase [Candidatus Woesearchaeota archaeon]MBT3538197.1 DEAD/DEAH box helicase [Candidatus Woesearchaeota archaeon]MBT7105866.1 DEAD/DEAH box helicase [Candidatus Woesearchaeota archaeon]MBT7930703.1 DEAD/DEAH box helicase [Candidatus Woesearchaeota archaeon]